MNQQEIVQLIGERESESIEWKEGFGDRVIETAGAFANTKGGNIFIGVTNEGKIRGITLGKETLQQWANQIAQKAKPHIVLDIDKYEISEKVGKAVAVIKIQESLQKPISVGDKYYKRVDNSNRPMTQQEIAQMWHSTPWDVLPINGDISLKGLDAITVERFTRRAVKKGRLPHEYIDDEMQTVLERLHLIADGRMLNGALLLFGKNPNQYFPNFITRIQRLKTEDEIIDDKWIAGNLFEQCEGSVAVLKQNIRVGAKIEGMEREDIYEYPIPAIREALLNALAHRDYFKEAEFIHIKVYDDRIRIYSPGGLPSGITIEDLKKEHGPHPRNPRIAKIFYLAGYVEESGTGTIRMINRMQEAGLPEPKFEEREGGFSVYFYKDIYNIESLQRMGLTERQIKAVLHAKEKGSIANKEYRELTGLSDEGALRDLRDLLKRNILESQGRGRTVRYVLVHR